MKGNVVIVHDFWSHLSHAHPCTAQWTAGWCPQWGGECHWLPHSFSEDFSVRKQTWKVRITCWAPFSIVWVWFLSLCPLYFPEEVTYLLCLHCWCSATTKSSCPLPDECFFPNSQWEEINADFHQECVTAFTAQMRGPAYNFSSYFIQLTPAPPHSSDWVPDIIPGWA